MATSTDDHSGKADFRGSTVRAPQREAEVWGNDSIW
jgi:hypothetical protein